MTCCDSLSLLACERSAALAKKQMVSSCDDESTNVLDKQLSKDQLVGLLQKVLPTMTEQELEMLISAGVDGNGASDVVSFQHFYDWMTAGQANSKPYPEVLETDAQKQSCPGGLASCNNDMETSGCKQVTMGQWAPPSPAHNDSGKNIAQLVAEASRELLPRRIIFLRHGESEGNVDTKVYRDKPDNAVELTSLGSHQARQAGVRIKELIGDDRVHMFVSPFQRTLQTARNVELALKGQVQQIEKDPRIREQEFGNLQGDDFSKYREEQKVVGRYFYRFPTGESGSDVYVRVKDWWDNSVLQLNLRPKYKQVDTVVVVTHGLTMRFILMQLFMWSPNTFHTVFNAGNCEMYVLQKDDSLPGHSPYALDPRQGDMPSSSIELMVVFKDGQRKLRLKNYLSVPMPRTRQLPVVRKMLAEQHNLDPEDIVEIDFYAGKFSKYM